jgi:hypothetical protein
VLRVLAAERSPDSYIAGGIALNREGPRFSSDIEAVSKLIWVRKIGHPDSV